MHKVSVAECGWEKKRRWMLGTRAAVSREEISNAAVFAAITVFTLSQIVTSTSTAQPGRHVLSLLLTPSSKSPWRLQYLAPAEMIPGKAMSKCFAMASTFSTESVVYHGPSWWYIFMRQGDTVTK